MPSRRLAVSALRLLSPPWIRVVVGVLVAAAFLGVAGEATTSRSPADRLPAGADATEAAIRQEALPRARTSAAIVVYRRADGRLTGADRKRIAAARRAFAPLAQDGRPSPARVAPDGRAAIVSVPLRAVPSGVDGPDADRLERTIEALRAEVGRDRPPGLEAAVTGPAALQVDLSNVFAGADTRLLAVTALVVALLLLITYRSPWLWLVPLTVVALGDRVAASLLALLSREAGLDVDGTTSGIVSVLVFGAGTNYALLLVARYREELRRHPSTATAMRAAVRRAAPAILASSGTVSLSLMTLVLADLPLNRNLGLSGALGIATAVVFVLGLLPPALLLVGRSAFWPLVPRHGDADPARDGWWSRLGTAITARPRPVVLVTTALLAALALGTTGATTGLSQVEQLRDRPDSVVGQELVERSFGGGLGEPAAILTAAGTEDRVAAIARDTRGIVGVDDGPASDRWAQVTVRLDGAPGSDASLAAVRALRERLAGTPGDPRVGGGDAEDLDERAAADRDRGVVVPLVLLVVSLVLLGLLRSIVAAVLLTITNVVSWAAALGCAVLAFEHALDFPALDAPVALLSFLFLVALGVDYNIFLITRAREEAVRASTRRSIVVALARTGGVITSAGIVLSAVFAVLGILPLITLTQLGIVVGIGILIDTLLVRTVLVPALVTAVGPRFWWPSDPSRGTSIART